jgi:hypothetical protein
MNHDLSCLTLIRGSLIGQYMGFSGPGSLGLVLFTEPDSQKKKSYLLATLCLWSKLCTELGAENL